LWGGLVWGVRSVYLEGLWGVGRGGGYIIDEMGCIVFYAGVHKKKIVGFSS